MVMLTTNGGIETQVMMREVYRNRVPVGLVLLRHVVREEYETEQCNARKMIGNTSE